MTHYFAYGSNMDEGQMRDRCGDDAVLFDIAKLHGYRFIINTRGKATVIPQPSREVYGIVWSITEDCERSLDCYEGVKYKTYKKETLDVEMITVKASSALVYIASDITPGSPAADYMEKIVAAAERHKDKIPDKYVAGLRAWLPTSS
jgi:gamma-glutamylcyclotransferase